MKPEKELAAERMAFTWHLYAPVFLPGFFGDLFFAQKASNFFLFLYAIEFVNVTVTACQIANKPYIKAITTKSIRIEHMNK